MQTFTYNALDAQGRSASGELIAENRSAALSQISELGLMPVSLEARGDGESKPAAKATTPVKKGRVPAAQVESFTRELANLLAAGVPLGRALTVLAREASHPASRRQWQAVHDDVVGGMPLADALGRWPGSFPAVYVAMVRAGETGGFLDVVLNQIADLRAREGELLGKVKAAMVYPAVLATLAVGVLIFLMTFFIPRFTGIFEDFGASLPQLTRMIVATSKAIVSYGWIAAPVVVGAVLALRRALHTPSGKRWLERMLLKTPALGVVLARFALVRFCRMLGTLLGSGVSLVTALRVAKEAIGNQTLSDAVNRAIDEVKQGAALSRSLGMCPQLFPGSVIEMVAVAEESGRLDKELTRLAQSYELELDRRMRMLVALAEPLLLFVMAALIGTIVVGMLLPIFTLQELIK